MNHHQQLAHVYWTSNTLDMTAQKKLIFKLQTFIEIITFRLVDAKTTYSSIMDVALFFALWRKKESCTLNIVSVKFALLLLLLYFCWRSENLIPPLCAVLACARIIVIIISQNSIIAAYYLLYGKSRFQLISTFCLHIYRHAFFGYWNIVDSIKKNVFVSMTILCALHMDFFFI